MNVGSLFSGIGGIEIGFERQGFKTKWFVENDEYAKAVLRKRFPGTLVYGDITEIDFRSLPGVDVLTGGFPCQDISNAGKRAGIEGSRSSLWKYYAEAIRVLRPKFVFIENVSAILGRGLNVVLGDLAEVGYDAEWHCVSASSVGAHHRRDRIFIIAYPSDASDSGYEWFGGEQCSEVLQEKNRNVENSERNRIRKRNSEEVDRGKEECQHTNKFECTGWWAVEPGLGRVADGVPNRVDRIRCLGNAVVPQVAEVFARAIKEKWCEVER